MQVNLNYITCFSSAQHQYKGRGKIITAAYFLIKTGLKTAVYCLGTMITTCPD